MVKRLNDTDRNILEFRPDIDFVEPDLEPQAPNPIQVEAEAPQVEDARAYRDQVKRLAQAVNVLAAAVQARADLRAQNMVIALDPIIDADTIQAMRRRYPDADPNQITYDQYRACKDCIRATGEEIGNKASITPDEVEAVRDEAAQSKRAASTGRGGNADGGAAGLAGGSGTTGGGAGSPAVGGRRSGKGGGAPITGIGAQLGGFNTEASRNGGLRPELDARTTVIESIDIDDFQINMICILVNFIWKSFIKPIFNAVKLPPFGPSIGDLLPDRLCNPGIDIDTPGLAILGIIGFKKPQQPQIPEEAPEA